MTENHVNVQYLPWTDPLDAAARVADAVWVLLHSSRREEYSGRYSLLALNPLRQVQGAGFKELARCLTQDEGAFHNAWFGYLGYGLRHELETLPRDREAWITLPDLWMARFATLYRFDHHLRRIERYGERHAWENAETLPLPAVPDVETLSSNMRREEYLSKVAEITAAIMRGELYQANLTRKFRGRFHAAPHCFALFARLCACSPAPYSAYIRMGESALLSSSPERFLTMDPAGRITVRPIKGSSARFADAEKDARSKYELEHSAKDRAENLMIVDLMRNDLSRVSEVGSVRVEKLFEATSHTGVHHLSSTVSGQRRRNINALDVVKACFPPGSMTGAPKIRAMELCSALERDARGVYSGALGWFGGDGSVDLSVVIRTIVIQGDRFEFQVGGGIVADSTPENEWRETMVKARGVAWALGIGMEELEAL